MSIAVYPGSFDPITRGHLNIIRRTALVFDKLYVCVMINSDKTPLFSRDERVDFIKRTTVKFENVEVESSEQLLVEYMKERDAKVIVKGLRAVSDFDKEFQIALINRKLDAGIETLFMPSSEKYTYLSSSAVKEMTRYGADLKSFVPREIIDDVIKKVENEGMMFK
ncbi:MAG: pantetheine-phosphate adenylyltransferase [Oscillospiraceae bacterium]|jgi:pantetheine-phosphate adenylyltransferase|nr:pantetheine-phosphate adenylyltransferase [Oscillospiraceae bacterium]